MPSRPHSTNFFSSITYEMFQRLKFKISGPLDLAEKSYEDLFFHFQQPLAAFNDLHWPPSLRNLESICQKLSKMVWHLHIGPKMSSLEPPEVLSQIWSNSVEKCEPTERPLLEVSRFFQWCQETPLGILRRFHTKKWILSEILSFVGRCRDSSIKEILNVLLSDALNLVVSPLLAY